MEQSMLISPIGWLEREVEDSIKLNACIGTKKYSFSQIDSQRDAHAVPFVLLLHL